MRHGYGGAASSLHTRTCSMLCPLPAPHIQSRLQRPSPPPPHPPPPHPGSPSPRLDAPMTATRSASPFGSPCSSTRQAAASGSANAASASLSCCGTRCRLAGGSHTYCASAPSRLMMPRTLLAPRGWGRGICVGVGGGGGGGTASHARVQVCVRAGGGEGVMCTTAPGRCHGHCGLTHIVEGAEGGASNRTRVTAPNPTPIHPHVTIPPAGAPAGRMVALEDCVCAAEVAVVAVYLPHHARPQLQRQAVRAGRRAAHRRRLRRGAGAGCRVGQAHDRADELVAQDAAESGHVAAA